MPNFGWLFIKRCFEIREKSDMRGEIQCGGMVTIIAEALGYEDYLVAETPVSNHYALDIDAFIERKYLRRTVNYDVYSWKHLGSHYCYLPCPRKTTMYKEGNRWWFDREELKPEDMHLELAGPEGKRTAAAAQAAQRRPPPDMGGTSTTAPARASVSYPFDLSQLRQGLSEVMSPFDSRFERQDAILRDLDIMTSGLYHASVQRGEVVPPVNYPNRPFQEGPIPAQGHPYHPTPVESGYDWRIAGRCDPRGDPAYPPPDAFPEGFTGGWEPTGRPDYGQYPNFPNYDWPPYTNAQGPDVDPNYNFYHSRLPHPSMNTDGLITLPSILEQEKGKRPMELSSDEE